MNAAPRPYEQRKTDTRAKLEHGGDAWVASASPSGDAHLVPVTMVWDYGRLICAVPEESVTARNVVETRRARVGFGPTRDVVMIDADLDQVVSTGESESDVGATFAARGDWDPRESPGYVFLTFRPRRIQAWREANEIAGRTLMRDGEWLA